MTEASYASLGPTLLARKGGAKPAMRPQMAAMTAAESAGAAAAANLEDLGWNDMGEDDRPHDSHIVQLTPCEAASEADEAVEGENEDALVELEPVARKAAPAVVPQPAVRRQQEELAGRLVQDNDIDVDEVAERPAPRPRKPAVDRGKRAAFTLRLDGERHLKLRLASTIRNASAQQLVTEALDALLGDMPEINALAAQVQRPKS